MCTTSNCSSEIAKLFWMLRPFNQVHRTDIFDFSNYSNGFISLVKWLCFISNFFLWWSQKHKHNLFPIKSGPFSNVVLNHTIIKCFFNVWVSFKPHIKWVSTSFIPLSHSNLFFFCFFFLSLSLGLYFCTIHYL